MHNKYCTACTQGLSIETHKCHKNCSELSSEFETDIILEGFKNAEKHMAYDTYDSLVMVTAQYIQLYYYMYQYGVVT